MRNQIFRTHQVSNMHDLCIRKIGTWDTVFLCCMCNINAVGFMHKVFWKTEETFDRNKLKFVIGCTILGIGWISDGNVKGLFYPGKLLKSYHLHVLQLRVTHIKQNRITYQRYFLINVRLIRLYLLSTVPLVTC